jgi:hypothetical protein
MNEHRKVVGRPFRLGESGNPGGRPKELRDVIELARSHAPEAIETLALIMANPQAPPAARVAAANGILDRGYGRPKETVDHTVRTTLEDLVMESYRLRNQRDKLEPPTIEAEELNLVTR